MENRIGHAEAQSGTDYFTQGWYYFEINLCIIVCRRDSQGKRYRAVVMRLKTAINAD